MRTPRLPDTATGDPDLIRRVAALEQPGRRLCVVMVDRNEVRSAYWGGAGPDTEYEIGSITKGLTGLALADAVARGELALVDCLGNHLPELSGPAADLTLEAVATHHSGLPPLPITLGVVARVWWGALTASNPYVHDRAAVLAQASATTLRSTTFEYSNLGGALVGHVGAAASGLDYDAWLDRALLTPLGLSATRVAHAQCPAPGGIDRAGRRQEPWVLHGYAPAGGVVSTPRDMTRLLRALITGAAPGMAAATRLVNLDDGGIGMLWFQEPSGAWWHNGGTGGYSSYLAFEPDRGRGVLVLSDVSDGATQIGWALLESNVGGTR